MMPAPALRESVYTEYFGLQCEPFRVTPDPKFFFAGPDYRLLAAGLSAALREPEGICLLSGLPGSGKTLLLRQVLHSLGPQVPSALIWSSNLEYADFLASVSTQLGGDAADALASKPGQVIEASARRAMGEGSRPVLVVDEAHSLPDSVTCLLPRLTQLRLGGAQALAIVLAVEEGHRRRLISRLGGEHLGLELVVAPMDDDQVQSYVAHRLRVAGYRGSSLFTVEALQALAEVAGGVPRLVNMIAGKALFLAYLSAQTRVGARLIKEVAVEIWRAAAEEPAATKSGTLPDRNPGAATGPSPSGHQVGDPGPVDVATTPAQRYVDLRAVLCDEDAPTSQQAVSAKDSRPPRPLFSSLNVVLLLLSLGLASLVATETGRGWIRTVGTPGVEHLEAFVVWALARRETTAIGSTPSPAQTLRPAESADTVDTEGQASNDALAAPVEPEFPQESTRSKPASSPVPAQSEVPVAENTGRLLEVTPMLPAEPEVEEDVDLSLVGQEIERTRMVRALMSLAAEYLEAGRYTEPPGANAYQSYLDVLVLDPDNVEASSAIEALRARLERYARIAMEMGDWAGATRYYESVLTITPQSKTAQESLNRAQHFGGTQR